jgi:hypothetical protein
MELIQPVNKLCGKSEAQRFAVKEGRRGFSEEEEQKEEEIN